MEGYVKAKDGFRVHFRYFPVEHAKGAIHLIHGAGEYKERYYDFIAYLNQAGYSCIISDLRGHGHSVDKRFVFGHMENPEEVIDDLYRITDYLKEKEPGKKIFLFGHSMGSLLARNYLKKKDDELAGLVLCGTVRPERAAGLAVALSRFLCFLTGGSYGRSRIVTGFIDLSKPAEEWISHNPENIKNYYGSHLGSVRFDNGAALTVLLLVRDLTRPEQYRVKNPGLPILSLSGVDDPVTKGHRGLLASKKALQRIGYKTIRIKQYSRMMHEILHEEDKKTVYRDVVKFLDGILEKDENGFDN